MLDAGKPGWIVFKTAIGHDAQDQSSADYSSWSDRGLGVIVVLVNGYLPEGTLPNSADYADFAARCANFVGNSQGARIWVIGNEMNHPSERPGVEYDYNQSIPRLVQPGEVITPEHYAQRVPALPRRHPRGARACKRRGVDRRGSALESLRRYTRAILPAIGCSTSGTS